MLARSDRPRSWRLFREALESDVADIQGGTTPEGIHLGAMAGTVDILQRAYTGVETRGNVLWFNPALPEGLGILHMHLRYRGHSLEVEITPKHLKIYALPCGAGPIHIGLKGKVLDLKMGDTLELEL